MGAAYRVFAALKGMDRRGMGSFTQGEVSAESIKTH
jgi:hypothetical protein